MRRLATFIGLIGLLAGGAQAQVTSASSLAPTASSATVIPSATIAVGSAAHPLSKADVDAWLDGYLPYALRAGDIPGAVAVVVKDGKILTARGFGFADLATRTPVDPEKTLFRPGSVSKLVTWTAVMQLVGEGRLDLDRDVNTYLDFTIPPYAGKPVTLRQIMTHTAGFEEAGKGIISYDAKDDVGIAAYLKRWTPRRIFAPGTTPAYSNWATTLAGYIVARASGEDFDTYVKRHIFDPLGMHDSTFRQPLPANLAPQMATGYPKPGEAKGFEFVVPAPAGALSASGTDMGRFMIAHLQHGELDGQRILPAAVADVMHDSPLGKVDPLSLMPPLNRMELGFFETNINGREVIGHLGDTSAFHTSLHLFMKDGVGLYVSFNSPGKAGAVGALRTAVFEDFADRYFPTIAAADGRVDATTAKRHVEMMVGNWTASRRADSSFLSVVYGLIGQTTVSVGSKGELVVPSLMAPGGRPRQWVEIAPFVWRDVYGHERLAAKVIDGKVARWTFDLAAPFEVFLPVAAAVSASWLLPVAYASIAVLLLTALYWPVTWYARRVYRASHPLTGVDLRAYRATRVMAALEIALLVGWAALVAAIFDGGTPSPTMNAVLTGLEFGSIVILFGTVLIAGWNLVATWSGGRRIAAKLWSVLIVVAGAILLYVGVVFHLTTLTTYF
ncbi:serine hydrolase domain-containing protein [Glacieibacterium megasporae]|uniref:serine hydrolase domain-containing protein n=1 Tax=Glacieibacterium megasporae TaxID=2835787 RepID=UPI001C1E6B1F|nr:serine hydrolase domain-containing protein [Polymorphobacter megasporae]UAJ11043.1 beta-lactamase family protein [Polymorphobacter megasporae]